MPQYRIADAAEMLGVSDDTIRRWIEHGKLPAGSDRSNVKVVEGASLAAFAREHARPPADPSQVSRSARNRFVGLITDVTFGTLMTQVEIHCPSHRVVSLMSTEAARELGLTPGMRAVAIVKSTHVTMETVTKESRPPHARGAEDV